MQEQQITTDMVREVFGWYLQEMRDCGHSPEEICREIPGYTMTALCRVDQCDCTVLVTRYQSRIVMVGHIPEQRCPVIRPFPVWERPAVPDELPSMEEIQRRRQARLDRDMARIRTLVGGE